MRLVAVVAFFGVLWFILWRQLSGEWSVNDQYSYGWFVPFFSLILFWLRWEDRPKPESANRKPERKVLLAFAIFALLLLFPIRVFEIGNPDWRPLSWLHTLCVVAITLIFLCSIGGKQWLEHFAFPVAFILVAVPWVTQIEAPIIQGLMQTIAAIAAETANLLGIPAEVQGNLIRVRTGLIGVNEACSGVRSLQTSLMIGLLFGELKRLSIKRRLFLVLGAIAIALIANFLRAMFLVWIGATENITAINRWHDVAGYGIVALVFGGSLLLTWLLGKRSGYWLLANSHSRTNNEEPRTRNRAAPINFLLPTFYFAAAICWIVFSEIAAAAWYRAHERTVVAAPRWMVNWPKNEPGFHEMKIDEGVRSTLRYNDASEAAWNITLSKLSEDGSTRASSARCISYFFRWNQGGSSVIRARAHRPDICLPAAGWRQISDRGVSNYRANGNVILPFHHLVFRQGDAGIVTAHTFFCLQEDEVRASEPRPDLQMSDGTQPDWSFRARSWVVLNGARNLGQQILEVVLLTPAPVDDEIVEHKFAELLPAIIRTKTGN